MINMSAVSPVKLELSSRFRFRCHKGISCFTKCCSNIDIMLTPYDIIVMKRRLGLTSEEFLDKYTFIEADPKASYPFVFLKMQNNTEKNCPFVTPEGCSIYEDRPANCRYYPIGQGTLKKNIDGNIVDEEFFFFVKEEHCKGFEEPNEWSIGSWREDQGVDIYDEMNREWKKILLSRSIPGQNIDEKKQAMFYMACYDMDRFRRFIFNSRFLEKFEVEDDVVDKMREDDVELMRFGFRLMKYVLLLEETLKLRRED